MSVDKKIVDYTTEELLDELDYCGFDTYYNSIRTIVVNEIKRRLDLLKEQEWIPVTERLPKCMANKVLVYLQHEDLVDQIGYGHYERYQGVEMWYDLESGKQFSNRGYTVTHWMPLPESPKGERLALS